MASHNRTIPIMTQAAPAAIEAEPSLYSETFAVKAAPGTDGTAVSVRVDYFRMLLPNVDRLSLYHIKVTSADGRELKIIPIKKEVIQAGFRQPPLNSRRDKCATDYHSTMVVLADGAPPSIPVTISLPAQGNGVEQTYNMTITRTHILEKSDLQHFLQGKGQFDCSTWLTALNILARHVAAPNTVKVGRDRFFPLDPGASNFPLGLNARRGFFASVRPVAGQVVMNMHGVAAAFINEQPLHLYFEVHHRDANLNLRTSELRPFDSRFKALMRGLRVKLLYTPPGASSGGRSTIHAKPPQDGKIRRVNGFGASAAQQTFKHDTHGVITVQKYFNEHVLAVGHTLQYPHTLVCDLGTREKPNYVPAELLYILPNQPFPGRLPEIAMREMIKVAQRPPLQNVEMNEGAFAPGKMFDAQALAAAQENSVKLTEKMMITDGRVLRIPDLLYKGAIKHKGCEADGPLRRGRWDIRGKTFRTSGKMGALGVIEIGGQAQDQRASYQALAKALTRYGLMGAHKVCIAQAPSVSFQDLCAASETLLRDKDFSNDKVRFILILLPASSADPYDRVKWWADTQVGAHVVCVTPQNVGKLGNPQFQGNLALKFNAKAGGHNHVLSDAELKHLHHDGPTMVVGADVTHPGPGSIPSCPSIAAVVASDDKLAVNYPGSLRLQRSKQEMIEDLASMMVERLRQWYEKNKALPANILFFRDGVSESQFAAVKNVELPRIQEACEKLGKEDAKFADYRPKITLIVCGKRHHTRFYPAEKVEKAREWTIDLNKNFKPGLVVDDQAVRNPYHFDFFLQSHSALKGTARPCHYFVIHNAMDLDANQLQRITFNLCWTFARALTPVSYASPAYYADLLAERGRCYISPFLAPAHVARPSDSRLFDGMRITKTTTQEEKDVFVLEKIKNGFGMSEYPAWAGAGRQNPFCKEVSGTMFYI